MARLDLVQIGIRFRVGNDPGDETFRENLGNSKTNSINRNRALGRNVVGERLG